MQLDNRFSEDIIKIFHNSKGSVENNILKWTNNAAEKSQQKKINWDTYSEKPYSPHAAGQYEHRLQQTTYNQPKKSLNNPIEGNIIHETQPPILETPENHPNDNIED